MNEEDKNKSEKSGSDKDSIEEDFEVDEDSDDGSDIEQQMDKFKTHKEVQNNNIMKPPIQSTDKKRAISAKYELRAQPKTVIQKSDKI